MLEKIKEVPFIDESSAVKVFTRDGKIVLERTDRVVWGQETTTIESEGVSCYVEADKFFALINDIKSLEQGTCLKVTLKNNAVYELPFVPVEWDAQQMPEDYQSTITFKLSDLMLCTLKNLIKPELQCIYIDQDGAVSCDYISACISTAVKSQVPFLLPPDVQELVDGRICKIKVDETKIFIRANDFDIVTSKPTAGDDAWWDSLRGMFSELPTFKTASALAEGLKRLVLFGDYVTFDGQKALVEANFEPFEFTDLGCNKYSIERLSKLLTTANAIAQRDGTLALKNDSSMFLVSPMDEA